MIGPDVARRRKEIEELRERIRALPTAEQAKVVRGVLSPALELRLVLERFWARTRNKDPRAIARAVHAARRQAEREYAARREAERERTRAAP
jgi:hypothetical protein